MAPAWNAHKCAHPPQHWQSPVGAHLVYRGTKPLPPAPSDPIECEGAYAEFATPSPRRDAQAYDAGHGCADFNCTTMTPPCLGESWRRRAAHT